MSKDNLQLIKDRTCPKCGSNWDGGSILETFIEQRNSGVKVWLYIS